TEAAPRPARRVEVWAQQQLVSSGPRQHAMLMSIACKFRKTSDYEDDEKHELGREFRDCAGRGSIRPEPECTRCGHDADNRECEAQAGEQPLRRKIERSDKPTREEQRADDTHICHRCR